MRFYLTAAIPYVNAKPHMGHALEFVQGDALARYHREKGDDVRYATGADENSLKIVQAAEKEGMTPIQLSDLYAGKFQEFLKQFEISIDAFVRSSSKEHFAVAQEMWKKCDEAGDIYKKSYKGLYCVSCEAFYTPEEIKDGSCVYHPGKPIETVEEENYFFKLSKYQDQLFKLIDSDEYKIVPQARKNEVLGFIKSGLEDFSISRSVKRARGWGVPVPGDDTQIMYVWFDAMNVYRTASSALSSESSVIAPAHRSFSEGGSSRSNPSPVSASSSPKSYKLTANSSSCWPANLHIIGKDILRFHAVYWPAMLLSSKIALPKELFVHGFITANGQKMSKSLGNVVDPVEFANKVGVDALRYYLLREIPSDDDGDFSEEKFKARYNADLANGLGNFASRVLTLSEKLNPWSLFTDYSLLSADIKHAIAEVRKSVDLAMNERRFHDALAHVWRLVSFGDKMVNATKPWELKDEDPKKREVLSELLVLLNEISIQIKPFMPEIAQKLSDCIIKDGDKIVSVHKPTTGLFPRI